LPLARSSVLFRIRRSPFQERLGQQINGRATAFPERRGKPVTSLTRSGATVTARCTGHGFFTGQIISIVGANETGFNTSAFITVVDANTFAYSLDFLASPASPATGTIVAMRGYTFSEITGNNANTITYRASLQGSEYELRFEPGDTFALFKVVQAMDQPAEWEALSEWRQAHPSRGWNNQTTSPWYEWNNTREGGIKLNFNAIHLTIRQNEHYFNDTVKPDYTPFVYPHPLVSGTTDTLPAPSGLRIRGSP
jgi:hypothetical protein